MAPFGQEVAPPMSRVKFFQRFQINPYIKIDHNEGIKNKFFYTTKLFVQYMGCSRFICQDVAR